MFKYNAKLKRIVDGDTMYLDIDLGFGVTKTIDIRLNRINCPEIRGPQKKFGIKVTKYVFDQFNAAGNECIIITKKIGKKEQGKGKYGRYVADIRLTIPSGYLDLVEGLVGTFPTYFVPSKSKMYDYVFNKKLLK